MKPKNVGYGYDEFWSDRDQRKTRRPRTNAQKAAAARRNRLKVSMARAIRIAGIDFDTSTEAGCQRAMNHIKNLLKLAHPDTGGDERQAAELNAARDTFERQRNSYRQRKNHCAVCGCTINSNATYCQQHQPQAKRTKALLLPEGFTPPPRPPRKPRKSTRVEIVDDPANLGFYTAPVQAVVRRWQDGARPEWIAEIFCAVARPIRFRDEVAEVRVAHPGLWLLAWELGAAITSVMEDKNGLDYWLLMRETLAVCRPRRDWSSAAIAYAGATGTAENESVTLSGGCVNGTNPPEAVLAEIITAAGGPPCTRAGVSRGLTRLKLRTPPAVRRDYHLSRHSVMK